MRNDFLLKAAGMTKKRGRRVKEKIIEWTLLFCALLSVITTAAMITVIAREAFAFFRHVGVMDFLFGRKWTPLLEPRSFGILPLVNGSLLIVLGAAVAALPAGLGIAIYLREYAHPRVRRTIKPALEILAGIPTVVYGYLALTFVTPLLAAVFPQTRVFNAASASIVVGIMVLPMVASLCDDALGAVPASLRHGAYALGATHMEVTTRVVLPSALSGIVASFILAVSRAIGETMAVTLAAGATPNITINPLESIQTLTAYIVQVSLGDTPAGTVEYQTIFAAAALLFAITLGMNIFSHRILRKFREVYE